MPKHRCLEQKNDAMSSLQGGDLKHHFPIGVNGFWPPTVPILLVNSQGSLIKQTMVHICIIYIPIIFLVYTHQIL